MAEWEKENKTSEMCYRPATNFLRISTKINGNEAREKKRVKLATNTHTHSHTHINKQP